MSVDNIYAQFKTQSQVRSDIVKQPDIPVLLKSNATKPDSFQRAQDTNNNTKTWLTIIGGLAAIGLGIFAYIKLKRVKRPPATPHQAPLPPPPIPPATLEEKQAAIARLNALYQKADSEKKVILKENGTVSISGWYDVSNKLYDNLRLSTYVPEGFREIAQLTRAETDKISVVSQQGWHFRIPRATLKGNKDCVDRISLNVKPDEKLIEQLDKYFADNISLQGEYKTPNSFAKWHERHDPITIYFYTPIKNKKVLDDIAAIAKPYVRSTGNNVLVGNKFAEGCAWQLSPTPEIKQKLRNMVQPFVDERSASSIAGVNADHLSAGEFWARNQIVNAITRKDVDLLMPANLPGM